VVKRSGSPRGLYEGRYLSDGYPDLEQTGSDYFIHAQPEEAGVSELLLCLSTLIDVSLEPKTVAVIGCGPKPLAVMEWLHRGFDAHGVEPVPGSAAAAAKFLGISGRVLRGTAEQLPFEDGSQRIVVLDTVLEHVDSVPKTMSEAYRVLAPGGVLYVYTTNRHRFSLTGANGEYRARFFNWFPRVVKESYVFKHLHFDPTLANYSPRPAVHWFTYSDLCQMGRDAGFAHFYSRLDLLPLDAPSIKRSAFRTLALRAFAAGMRNPWLRGVALLQYGNSIFMLKRK